MNRATASQVCSSSTTSTSTSTATGQSLNAFGVHGTGTGSDEHAKFDVQKVPAKSQPRSAILDGIYFRIVEIDSNGLKVRAACELCPKNKTIISGSTNATSNFKTHLKVNFIDSIACVKL